MSEHIMRRLKEQTPYTNVLDGELMKEAADEITRLREENARLRECIRFFASVIKSGEEWSETCQQKYAAAIREGVGASDSETPMRRSFSGGDDD